MFTRLINVPSDKSFFLFGPRGTGKTTWVKKNFPQAIYLDLLDDDLYTDLLAHPHRLESLIPVNNKQRIIIDEVQRVPALLNEVHRLIENKKLKFVLTGSSARKLRTKGVNLLAGRALTVHCYPLTAIEADKEYSLQRSLLFGQLPSVYSEKNPQSYLASYVRTYLREEILQEGLTRNLGAFTRFLEAASFSQGNVLNVSAIARECAVERKVVENYFSILEDLLIAYRLPVFTKKAKRKMAAHDKFYFFDTGVYRAIRPQGPLDNPQEAEGPALETLVLQELKAINEYKDLGYSLHYWRTSNNMEVDFVLYGKRGIKAFEVKRTAKISLDMFRGLKSFLSVYPSSKAYLIYGGDHREYHSGIEVIPVEEALKSLPEILA